MLGKLLKGKECGEDLCQPHNGEPGLALVVVVVVGSHVTIVTVGTIVTTGTITGTATASETTIVSETPGTTVTTVTTVTTGTIASAGITGILVMLVTIVTIVTTGSAEATETVTIGIHGTSVTTALVLTVTGQQAGSRRSVMKPLPGGRVPLIQGRISR